jgi:hypothetical protein
VKGYCLHEFPVGAGSESIVVQNNDGAVVATLSITFDSPAGLLVDLAYSGYLRNRRVLGRRCVETTKFAFDALDYRAVDADFRLALDILLSADARSCSLNFIRIMLDSMSGDCASGRWARKP